MAVIGSDVECDCIFHIAISFLNYSCKPKLNVNAKIRFKPSLRFT